MKAVHLLAIVAVSLSLVPDARAGALFQYNGKSYKRSDLQTATSQQLFELEVEHHRRVQSLLESALIEMHAQDVAKKKGKTAAKVKEDLVKVKDPSEKDVKAWYEKNKSKVPPGYKFDQIKGDIKVMLTRERQRDQTTKLVERLKREGNFKLALKEPVAPKFSIKTNGYPVKGDKGAKVTIVEFADYQCPHCKAAKPAVDKVLKKFKGKVNLVFLDFPVNRSGVSKLVAHGAACALEQNKYWEYHDLAFEKQAQLSKDSPAELAKTLKLDQKKFAGCMKTQRPVQFVDKAKQEGERLGINGTPALFVNGRRILSFHGDELEKAVRKAL